MYTNIKQASLPHPSPSCPSILPLTGHRVYLIMCSYGITHAVLRDCTRETKHKIETRLRKRCVKSPKPGSPCDKPTYDPRLDLGPSSKGGRCPACRDSGISVEIYQVKWVSLTVPLSIYTRSEHGGMIGGSTRLGSFTYEESSLSRTWAKVTANKLK